MDSTLSLSLSQLPNSFYPLGNFPYSNIPISAYWGVCFVATQSQTVISMKNNGTPNVALSSISLLYSKDAQEWNDFVPNTTSVMLNNSGDKVWIKAGSKGNSSFGASEDSCWCFATSKDVECHGDVTSLLNGNNSLSNLNRKTLIGVFRGSKITTAPKLPSKIISNNAYRGIFAYCRQLIEPPELPAASIPGGCYHHMFDYCKSLRSVPNIPNLTAANGDINSLRYMFRGCTSLTTAETLPLSVITSTANQTFEYMFQGCTNLVTPPKLNVTKLNSNNSMHGMFYGCSKLSAAPNLPAKSVNANSQYTDMFYGCNSLQTISVGLSSFTNCTNWMRGMNSLSGTFYCPPELGNNDTIARGVNACPTTWTVVNIN